MAALVCRKRSFVDESSSYPTSAKKFRRSSSPNKSQHSFLHLLMQRFPTIASQFVEDVAAQSGNDLEAAIAMMYKLGLEHQEHESALGPNSATMKDEAVPSGGDSNKVASGEEWVDLVLTEMKNATSVDDAKARAATVLQNFEKAVIHSSTSSETARNLEENALLKEKLAGAVRENAILKRAVVIQLERQKGFDDKAREVEDLKKVVTQYHEQLRTLEMNNYALRMHLQQAQAHQNNFTHGRFPPDVC